MLKFKGLKAAIGSKKEAFWTRVYDEADIATKQHEEGAIINRAIMEMAKSKIKKHRL